MNDCRAFSFLDNRWLQGKIAFYTVWRGWNLRWVKLLTYGRLLGLWIKGPLSSWDRERHAYMISIISVWNTSFTRESKWEVVDKYLDQLITQRYCFQRFLPLPTWNGVLLPKVCKNDNYLSFFIIILTALMNSSLIWTIFIFYHAVISVFLILATCIPLVQENWSAARVQPEGQAHE